jgi:hypothetical protein
VKYTDVINVDDMSEKLRLGINIYDMCISDMTSTFMTSLFFRHDFYIYDMCISDMTYIMWNTLMSSMYMSCLKNTYVYFRHDIGIDDMSVFKTWHAQKNTNVINVCLMSEKDDQSN